MTDTYPSYATGFEGFMCNDGVVRCVSWDLHHPKKCTFIEKCHSEGCNTMVCTVFGGDACYQCGKRFFACGECVYEHLHTGQRSCFGCVHNSGRFAYPPEEMACNRCGEKYSTCIIPGAEDEKVCKKCLGYDNNYHSGSDLD